VAAPTITATPNPATSQVTVSYKNDVVPEEQLPIEEYRITKKTGELVASRKVANLKTVQIDVSNLPTDIYLLNIKLLSAGKREFKLVSDNTVSLERDCFISNEAVP
jgi:LEA14-like dessication related protein